MRTGTQLSLGALLSAFAVASTIALACGPSGSSPSAASSPDGTSRAPTGADPLPAEGSAEWATSGSETTPGAQAPASRPGSAACVELAVDITNDPPDGGVAMNNATTAGDAGGSDRLASTLERVQQHRDRFRCCFDLWGRENPGKEVKVTLSLQLDPSGKLARAGFKPDETDLVDAEVERCMREVAERIDFPPSPSGKETTYNHRFQFKARR